MPNYQRKQKPLLVTDVSFSMTVELPDGLCHVHPGDKLVYEGNVLTVYTAEEFAREFDETPPIVFSPRDAVPPIKPWTNR